MAQTHETKEMADISMSEYRRTMRPVVSLITLGVSDFNRSLDFYKKLGFATDAKPDDPVAFFQLNNIILGLYDKKSLADDATVPNDGTGFSGITIAHNLGSEQEVDALFNEVKKIGATIIKPPKKTEWGGYSGYFSDPDGYLWEVAHNPFWTMQDDGTMKL